MSTTTVPVSAPTDRTDQSSAALSQRMAQLLSGFQQAQALYACAKLDIATALVDGPLPLVELAAATGTEQTALNRLLRFLCGIDVVRQRDDGMFVVTPFGATLAAGTPGSVRDLAIFWMETHYEAFGDLITTVRTGVTAFDVHFGQPLGDWLADKPEHVAGLVGAMNGVARWIKSDLLDGYVLPPGAVVADIGGADGTLVASLLADDPTRRGIVFDLPHVVTAAHNLLAERDLVDRVEVVGGDFFRSVPAADVYVLSTVLHDWDDERCARILGSIAAAARPGAHLVVLEAVVPDGNEPHPARFNDLTMLGMASGRERTRDEYAELFAAAGFTISQCISGPKHNPFSILEATSGQL
ncbi:MAG TPA: methyltransferase [Pseudonocardiaceae bacterium]|jgi:hypothetical protein|nr:methyltransferase [Pseudonocardiaceae bacterium]